MKTAVINNRMMDDNAGFWTAELAEASAKNYKKNFAFEPASCDRQVEISHDDTTVTYEIRLYTKDADGNLTYTLGKNQTLPRYTER